MFIREKRIKIRDKVYTYHYFVKSKRVGDRVFQIMLRKVDPDDKLQREMDELEQDEMDYEREEGRCFGE